MEIFSCYHFDGHICASKYLKSFFLRRLNQLGLSRPIHYSPYAFHPGLIKSHNIDKGPIDSILNGKKVIVYMGSLRRNYGFWDMMSAFRMLSSCRKDFIAVILGQGPELEPGREWIKEHSLTENIFLEGFIDDDDLSNYFSQASVFISPLYHSDQDRARCPSKIFMYLPYNRPVVTCKVGEAFEIFKDQGFYYEPDDLSSMVFCLGKALDTKEYSLPFEADIHTYRSRTVSFLSWVRTVRPDLMPLSYE